MATQNDAETHETPLSTGYELFETFWLGVIDQEVPL